MLNPGIKDQPEVMSDLTISFAMMEMDGRCIIPLNGKKWEANLTGGVLYLSERNPQKEKNPFNPTEGKGLDE